MQRLLGLIRSEFKYKKIDFENDKWHRNLPNTSGWYLLSTNTPFEVFTSLPAPPSMYKNKDGETKKCRNYNIKSRAQTFSKSAECYMPRINEQSMQVVYSGKAKNILDRAKDHTFGHPGTAALAISKYTELVKYRWEFLSLIHI